jgi:hypothetical protein
MFQPLVGERRNGSFERRASNRYRAACGYDPSNVLRMSIPQFNTVRHVGK